MTQKKAVPHAQKSLEVGYWVAVTIRAGTMPLRSYVGQIEAIDERGLRLTLIDWVVYRACGNDLFIPWHSLEGALVATPQHDLQMWIESAKRWQQAMIEDNKKAEQTSNPPTETHRDIKPFKVMTISELMEMEEED